MDRITGASTIDLGAGRRGFRDKNTTAGVPGTIVSAAHMNAVQEELLALIERSGVAPSAADLEQLVRSIRSQRLNWMMAAGTANALTLTPSPSFTALGDLTGVPLRFTVATTNTLTATLSVNGLPAKPIIYANGNPTTAGHLFQGRLCEVFYAPALDAFVLTSVGFGEVAAPFSGARAVVYATPGSYSWTVPAGWSLADVEVYGGGGGGAGSWLGGGSNGPGGGGAGGGYSRQMFNIIPGQSYTVVVGAAGAAGAAGSNGGTGGSSSFGGTMTALGGSGGRWAGDTIIGAGFGGSPGTASGGMINLTGSIGGGWSPYATLPAGIGGQGGSSPRGGPGGPANYASGAPGSTPGGGGSGCGGNIQLAGQPGGTGMVIITRIV